MTGSELKEARQKLGLTQHGLGGELHLTREMIGLMERDEKPIERRTELSMRYLLIADGHAKAVGVAAKRCKSGDPKAPVRSVKQTTR